MAFVNPKTAAELAAERLVQTKAKALSEALTTFNAGVAELVKGIPDTERESWGKQEHEARNVLADPTFQASYLGQLAISRGLNETTEELAVKVMANVSVYETAHAKLLGEYQSRIKAIEAEFQ